MYWLVRHLRLAHKFLRIVLLNVLMLVAPAEHLRAWMTGRYPVRTARISGHESATGPVAAGPADAATLHTQSNDLVRVVATFRLRTLGA